VLAPTREWEADVELRPSENEEDELTPPTVVQEGDELGLVEVDAVLSFDCQEIPDGLDSDTGRDLNTFTTSATRSDRERASCRETVYFPQTAV